MHKMAKIQIQTCLPTATESRRIMEVNRRMPAGKGVLECQAEIAAEWPETVQMAENKPPIFLKPHPIIHPRNGFCWLLLALFCYWEF